MTRARTTLAALALVIAGYTAGALTPTAHAYTQDTTRLLNNVVSELNGIRRSLEAIQRKIK